MTTTMGARCETQPENLTLENQKQNVATKSHATGVRAIDRDSIMKMRSQS